MVNANARSMKGTPMNDKPEYYDGDLLVENPDPDDEYILHECEVGDATFYVKVGSGCPNRRLGCGFVAEQDAE